MKSTFIRNRLFWTYIRNQPEKAYLTTLELNGSTLIGFTGFTPIKENNVSRSAVRGYRVTRETSQARPRYQGKRHCLLKTYS